MIVVKMIKECSICKKEFVVNSSSHAYCSKECKSIHLQNYAEIVKQRNKERSQINTSEELNISKHNKICPYCNISFICNHLSMKYCSKICKNKYGIKKTKEKYLQVRGGPILKLIDKKCFICKKIFKIYNSNTLKCCSRECSKIFDQQNNKKHHLSESFRFTRQLYKKTIKGKQLVKIQRNKRREQLNNCIHQWTSEEWKQKVEETNGVCPCCYYSFNNREHKLTLDHDPPIFFANRIYKETGVKLRYTIDQVQPLCSTCNAIKNKRDISIEQLREIVKQRRVIIQEPKHLYSSGSLNNKHTKI